MLKKAFIFGLLGLTASASALASSHREAPFITEIPKVDGSDFYLFRSYESGREGYVTFIANYLPLQNAYGGPNYFALDPDALYEIHIDNNGDAVEDLTFRFDLDLIINPPALEIGGELITVPLSNIGAIGPLATDTLNSSVQETFRLSMIRGDRRAGDETLAQNGTNGSDQFIKPLDNIGTKSFADYATYAENHIWDFSIEGCGDGRVFVGQRREGFVVNLGEVFDLVNLNPLGPRDGRSNTIADANVTALALELPISCVTNGSEPVIGAWTTASLPQGRILNPNTTTARNGTSNTGPSVEGGAYVQVSRLGSPLVNEVVIGIDQKDRFNGSEPKNDLRNFAKFVTNPSLPVLVDILFFGGQGDAVPDMPRNDLVAAFVTGVTASVNGEAFNFTQPANQTGVGEMLRLNTAVAPTPLANQNDLAFLACDLGGFPNGRRPIDDVVDIALTVMMGAIDGTNKNQLQTCDVSGPTPVVVNSGAVVNDGAKPNASAYRNSFPYLATPVAGAGA